MKVVPVQTVSKAPLRPSQTLRYLFNQIQAASTPDSSTASCPSSATKLLPLRCLLMVCLVKQPKCHILDLLHVVAVPQQLPVKHELHETWRC